MIDNNQAKVIFSDVISVQKVISSIDEKYHQTFINRLGISDEDYHLRLVALVKFLSIQSVLSIGSFIPVSRVVDDLWHEFILQTRFYREFCLLLQGKRFLDHESIDFDDYSKRESMGVKENLVEVMRWLGFHYGYFGEFTEQDKNLWVSVEFLSSEMNYSLDEINNSAKNVFDEMNKLNEIYNG